jgi:hypothetical protein
MGAEWCRKSWLWAIAALPLSSAPALAVCDVPTITGSNVHGRAYDRRFSISAPERGRYRLTVTADGSSRSAQWSSRRRQARTRRSYVWILVRTSRGPVAVAPSRSRRRTLVRPQGDDRQADPA